ncbi:MAG: hypothetical protein GF418_16470 [Chitinivibrionales bacterium]|nr:hypothetical protein [Chitinivibrionales bacterium]MBD3397217.1 hypothetical protein [Chitinivibrionales bacterium]
MKKLQRHRQIRDLLRELHLPGIRESFVDKAAEAAQEQLSYEEYLWGLLEI